jgi:alpha-galactosidase
LSHALRTVPIVLDIARDVERIAPDALLINYSNPLTRVCLAATRYTSVRVVGLCHQFSYVWGAVGRVLGAVTSPPDTVEARAEQYELSQWLDVQASGINHLTFLTMLRDRRTGRDLYPSFRERLAAYDPSKDPISRRIDQVFGLYPLQGDTHVGEYFAGLAAGDHPGPEFAFWAERGAVFADRLDATARGEAPVRPLLRLERPRHDDRAAAVIAAVVEGRNSYEHAVNVVNGTCMPDLPDWAVVEVPGIIGSSGVRGMSMDRLPPAPTALLQQQIAVQDRVVEAAVHGDRDAALQALLLDPLTSSDPVGAEAMLEELLRVHERHLPRFANQGLEPALTS